MRSGKGSKMNERINQALEEAAERVRQIDAENKIRLEFLLAEADFLDDEGYPTDEALEVVEKWHWLDSECWFNFIKGIWHLSSWGWHEGEEPDEWNEKDINYRYTISTAGWSGNESIIYAMEKNHMLWSMTWVQSRRGGHYIFEKKVFED